MNKSFKLVARYCCAFIAAVFVIAASTDAMAEPQYILRLNNFRIRDTTSPHNDTDYVYFTVVIGDPAVPGKSQVFGPTHAGLGSLNNGVYDLGWEFGPVTIDGSTKVLITYQIINNGTTDQATAISNDNEAVQKITAVVAPVGGTILDAFVPGAGSVVAVGVQGVVAGIGAGIKAISGLIHCDELVVSDALGTDGAQIRDWLKPSGFHTEVKPYSTPGQPGPFCRDAHYDVSWSVLPKEVRIDNHDKTLSLDVAGASLLNGAAINQFTTNNGPNQRWRLVPTNGVQHQDTVAIVSVNSGMAIDVPNGSRSGGTLIQQYPLHKAPYAPNQSWRIVPMYWGGILGAGIPFPGQNQSVQIINENSGLALDVPGFSTTPGHGIQQYQPNTGMNQQWFIVPNP